MEDFVIRSSTVGEISSIEKLYKRVAAIEGGLARTVSEISTEYIEQFVHNSLSNGIELVAVAKGTDHIVGEIHCYNNGLSTFAHVLSELTIVVDPDFQGKGIGKMLFTDLLRKIKTDRPDIIRVELLARESNERALRFYESIGFKVEGRLKNRIKSVSGGFEDDIFMAWYRN